MSNSYQKVILKVENLHKFFYRSPTLISFLKDFLSRKHHSTLSYKVLNDINFELYEGEIFGLVGESGSGKSTLAKTLIGLHRFDSGKIILYSTEISSSQNTYSNDSLNDTTNTNYTTCNIDIVSGLPKSSDNTTNNITNISSNSYALSKTCPHIQMIFQDPYASLNPKMTIKEILYEPLIIHKIYPQKDWDKIINYYLQEVGLEPENTLHRYPAEFSGGQRQRICICRALLLEPKIIIADEPVSALDVSIQAQILELFKKLNTTRKISFIFISHDLAVVKQICNRIGVIYKGNIVEILPSSCLLTDASHPYTLSLLYSAIKLRGIQNTNIPSPLLEKAHKAWNFITNIKKYKNDHILFESNILEIHNQHFARKVNFE